MDIALQKPFVFQHTLDFLRAFSPMAGEQKLGKDTLVKSWIVGGKAVTVTMKQDGDRLRCEVDQRVDEKILADKVASFLSAGEDLNGFYEIAKRDDAFAPVARKLRGFHHPKFGTPFEAAVWSVLNQRVGLGAARTMKARIVEKWGGGVAFPEAQAMSKLTEAQIGKTIGNTRKARAVFHVSQAFAKVDEKWLQTAPIGEVDAWLRKIWGVGDFASGFILYRGLGRARSLPWSDMFVRAAKSTYPGTTRKDLEKRAEAYGPWKGHWALYLWAVTLT